jgi:hypothetical protein
MLVPAAFTAWTVPPPATMTVYLPTNEVRQEFWHAVELSLGPAIFDRHVLAVGKARLIQPTLKRRDLSADRIGRFAMKKPDYWHCRLLRSGSVWPCCRSANEHDELASPHICSGAPVSGQTGTLIGTETGVKSIAQCTANVRNGSLAAATVALS